MRRLLYLLLLLPAALAAQERGPGQPDQTAIVVPDLILAVEELPLESVRATLPSAGDLSLGQLSLPLPEPSELQIDQSAFFLAAPQSTTAAIPAQGSSIYSTGRLGAGSVNHIVGEISLFKLGEDPRFRLRFLYEGLDGFQFEPAGTGYFQTENQVNASVEGSSPDLDYLTEAAFTERVTGLQGEGPFYSTGLRTVNGAGSLTLRPDPLLELSGEVDARYAARLQSASNVGSTPRDQEFALAPGLGINFTIGAVTLRGGVDYEIQSLTGERALFDQRISARLGTGIAAASWLDINASVGVYSEFTSELFYPWQMDISIYFSESLETELSGGFRLLPVSYLSLWQEQQIIAPGAGIGGSSDVLTPNEWFASARVGWSPLPGVTTSSFAEYIQRSHAVNLTRFVSADSRYEFVQQPLQSVAVGTIVGFTLSQQFSLQTSWQANLFERLTGVPVTTIGARATIGTADGRISATADAGFDLYPQPVLPRLDITGSFSIAEGVELDLVLSDLLAPVLETGRPAIGPQVSPDFPFIQPGFRASVLTRISL